MTLEETLVPEMAQPSQEPGAENVSTSDNPLAQAEAKYKELYDQHLRLAADFDNFRKRRQQEMDHQRKYGAESCLIALLPVLDNLHRAQGSLTEQSDAKVLLQSFSLLQRQLTEALASLGLQEVPAQGQPFDPNCHEAVGRQEVTNAPDESVLIVHQAGYQLHDRVIRPAMVVVASNPEGVASAPAATPTTSANPFEL